MPILNGSIQGEGTDPQGKKVPLPPQSALALMGPLVKARITAAPAVAHTILSKGGVLPTPVDGIALIDTGAASTCVDEAEVAAKLGMPVTGVGSMTSATHAAIPCSLHPVEMEVLGWPVKWQANRVMGANLEPHGIVALIGRDLLRNCLLVYNGSAGTFSLAL